jgi:hypothetical protein
MLSIPTLAVLLLYELRFLPPTLSQKNAKGWGTHRINSGDRKQLEKMGAGHCVGSVVPTLQPAKRGAAGFVVVQTGTRLCQPPTHSTHS